MRTPWITAIVRRWPGPDRFLTWMTKSERFQWADIRINQDGRVVKRRAYPNDMVAGVTIKSGTTLILRGETVESSEPIKVDVSIRLAFGKSFIGTFGCYPKRARESTVKDEA